MPEIKLQHIVSYSSQDTNNPAENLLKPDGVHKWKSANTGEKSLSAILQFEKASRIHSIDIGNDGAAFVEVLVGRSSSPNEDFKVILVTSSFMSPMESRNNTNRYSVRMFGSDKLSKPVSEEKWDRVKIICTQPFNKTTNYGLSFIKFHSPPSSENQSSASVSTVEKEDGLINPKKIGAFFFRRDEEDKKNLQVGSLFARQKDKPESSPLTGAAAIRAASNQARSTYLDTKSSTSTNNSSEVKKKRKHNLSDDEEATEVKKSKSKNGDSHRSHTPHERPTHQKEESKKEKQTDYLKKEKKSNSSSRDDVKSTSSSSSSSSSSHKNSHHKSEITTSKADVSKSNKPFNKIMDAVVFVLSGFQNPFRADLRDKAREMGAKYRPDWGSDCTHLVCAFANTPKYIMVKGRGRIVTKQWVLDCYRQRTLLPWRKYQLEEKQLDDDDEEEEENKEKMREARKKQQKEKEQKEEEEEQVIDEEEGEHSQQSSLMKSKSDPEYLPSMEDQDSTDDEEGVPSEEDTDDEVRRIKNAANARSESSGSFDTGPSTFNAADTLEINSNVDNDDDDDNDHGNNKDNDDDDDDDEAFGAATDVDEDDNSDSDSELPVLPDFFSNKHFFLYGNFSESERHELTRYITAYNGELEDYMNNSVNFVITSEQWDDNFDEALSNYPQLTFVYPKWLYSCHTKNKWVPYQLHIVTPSIE